MTNDYETTVTDLDTAIQVTESAYYNAQDEEDQADIDEALDLLKKVRARAQEKT